MSGPVFVDLLKMFFKPARSLTAPLSARVLLSAGMNASALEQLLKEYLEHKYGLVLNYFAIEGQMSADAEGVMGVTGNYRKAAGDKKIFFTATVNINSRKIENLQEY